MRGIHERCCDDVSVTADTLTSPPAASYQWFRDSLPLANETQQRLIALNDGIYFVQITDANGCTARSLPDTVSLAPFSATVSLPDIEAAPGEVILLPLGIAVSSNFSNSGAKSYQAKIRFDKKILYPSGSTPLGLISGNDRIITLNNSFDIANPNAGTIELLTMLSDAASTPIHFDELTWQGTGGALFKTIFQDGQVRVKICREGGDRLFEAGRKLQLFQNQPNPFNAATTVGFETIEGGPTQLYVLDCIGRRVATLFSGTMLPGKYQVVFDSGNLPSGVYLYVLQTPAQRLQRLMQCLK